MKQLVYVCLDGLGDDPNPDLGGQTPLEAARTPNLDRLAAQGSQGLVTTVGPDIAPESDIAVFAILGYDPRQQHPGRGVLEALGSGMDFRDGDLALRVNFATQDDGEIVDRRVGRDLPSEDSHALAQEVNEKVVLPGARFDLRATVEHRGALVVRSSAGPLSAEVGSAKPRTAGGSLGVALGTFESRVERAWRSTTRRPRTQPASSTLHRVGRPRVVEVNGAARRGRLAANLILCRDGGDHVPHLTRSEQFGRGSCFVEMPVERGSRWS